MAREWLRKLRVGSIAIVPVLLYTAPALAANPGLVAAGKAQYTQYCASCHGPEARGDGPKAAASTPKASDLTQLAKKHGGKFPYMEVVDIIDGTTPYPGHGSSEMPAWGNTFQSDLSGPAMDTAAVRGRLMLLTDYLRTIQVK